MLSSYMSSFRFAQRSHLSARIEAVRTNVIPEWVSREAYSVTWLGNHGMS